MFLHSKLEHRFVHYIPEQLEPGVIYISMDYATAAHSCCCGCGEQVITPFTPTDWELTFDGETVSLWPSIGNWNFRCRSHYIIRNCRIVGAEQVAKARTLWRENRRHRTQGTFRKHGKYRFAGLMGSNQEKDAQAAVLAAAVKSAGMLGIRGVSTQNRQRLRLRLRGKFLSHRDNQRTSLATPGC
jgi:hypothetical protein